MPCWFCIVWQGGERSGKYLAIALPVIMVTGLLFGVFCPPRLLRPFGPVDVTYGCDH